MNGLKIFDLYNETSNSQLDSFLNRLDSNLHIDKNENRVEGNFEWLSLMEDTIQYIDNIYLMIHF